MTANEKNAIDATETANRTVNDSSAPAVAIIDESMLRGKIHEIRGQKVMLDFELAEVYGYSTKRFNEQVKRNADKFDEDFMFRLTDAEIEELRSQNATAILSTMSRTLPYAFTEQGVYMLMTVLKGDLATRQSKALIRLFKRMKDRVEDSRALVGQREFLQLSMQVADSFSETMELSRELREVEASVAHVIDELDDCVHKSEIGNLAESLGKAADKYGWMLLDGQPVEAAATYADIYSRAQRSICVIDNYVGPRTLSLLGKARAGVAATLFTDNLAHSLDEADLEAFRSEYPGIALEVKPIGGFVHDRFIAIDYGTSAETVYHCGASSKDAGRRVTTILPMTSPETYRQLFDMLLYGPTPDV